MLIDKWNDAGPHLPAGAALEPGDLVFFGASPSSAGHVGIYAGAQGGQVMMVDAPHTGAAVRVEAFPAAPGGPLGQRHLPGRHPGPAADQRCRLLWNGMSGVRRREGGVS
jgi:hypothetical protein